MLYIYKPYSCLITSFSFLGDNNGVYADGEADKTFSFDDQSIRKGFIRKVYLILMVS